MKRIMIVLIMLLTGISIPVFGESAPVPGLSFFKLDNGLEVFVLENHSVPLTRIQVTFRCGALTQTPETDGIFHLYEHMLFKGNSMYKTETEFSAALTELGVSGWNGGTSTEYVTYYITVPSENTDKGLAFWSYAMRYPLFDEEELEIEKGVVCNEINGDLANPAVPLYAAIDKTLFSKYPWRRDVRGYDKIIRSATREMLQQMQAQYYIPNNAAIFVAGDVNPKEVLAEVEKYYGSWEKGADPWNPMPDPQLFPGLKEPVYMVYPDASIPQGIARFMLEMRGPDVIHDPAATYAADVWGFMIDSPEGNFKKNIFAATPGLYEKDKTNGSYFTQRDGGKIYFGTIALAKGKQPLTERVKLFEKAVFDEIKKTVADPDYFSKKDFSTCKTQLEDSQIISLEQPDAFVESLSFWWASASADYFFNYIKNLNAVSKADIDQFLKKYVIGNIPLVIVHMNDKDYAAAAPQFKQAGFTVITKNNCFWWEDK